MGAVDIAVLSAAVIEAAPVDACEDDLWRRHMDVNVDGIFACTRASVRHMLTRGTGKVVVIGSVSGMVGNAGFSAYCASKGLWVNLVRQMALDCAPPRGVNVNAVLPRLHQHRARRPLRRADESDHRRRRSGPPVGGTR